MGLRGKEIDSLHESALAEQRKKIVGDAIKEVKEMTLTVVDGDFPREVLARKNLRFGEYTMPSRRNSAESYDANRNGPAGKLEGNVYLGALPPKSDSLREDTSPDGTLIGRSTFEPRTFLSLAALSLAFCCGLAWFLRR